jgi:hypothetical protein
MKTIILVALILSSAFGWAKTSAADYAVDVHVSADHILSDCGGSNCFFTLQMIEATISGKKYELQDAASKKGLFPLGDYKARLIQSKQSRGLDVYEFLLPDGTTQQFTVVGQSEEIFN